MSGSPVQIVNMSIEFVQTIGEAEAYNVVADEWKGDWLFRGPRGGRWIAPSGQVTTWQLDKGMFWGPWYRMIGRRSEARYVRPGTRLAQRFGQ